MSPEIALHGHQSKGHDKCPPVPVVVENTSVRVGGKAVACVGDALQPHGCDDHSPHQGKISAGAPHVRIAGRKVARKGDSIECGPAQDELAEGFATVRVGNCGDDEYSKELIFNMLTSPQDKAILCMDEIAMAEAAASSGRDRKGWQYLSEMVTKWREQKNNGDACIINNEFDSGGQEPYFVDWHWMMEYERFAAEVQEMVELDYLFGPLGKEKLTSILEQEIIFQTEPTPFNYIDLPWRLQREYAFQSIKMDSVDITFDFMPRPDGLFAALGKLKIFALAEGEAIVLPDTSKEITVHRVAFFIHDAFSFTEDQILGGWNCDETRFDPTAVWLSNASFRKFRTRTGYGCDFRAMSVPEIVWQGSFSYVIN